MLHCVNAAGRAVGRLLPSPRGRRDSVPPRTRPSRLRPVIRGFARNDNEPPSLVVVPVLVPVVAGPMLVGALRARDGFDDALVARCDRGAWRDVEALSWFDTFRRGPHATRSPWPRSRLDPLRLAVGLSEPRPFRGRSGPDAPMHRADDFEPGRSPTVTSRREGDALVIAGVSDADGR